MGPPPSALAVRGDPPRSKHIFACWARSLTTSTAPRREWTAPEPAVVLRSVRQRAVAVLNPVVTSLRGLQQTTTLATVQERLGVRLTSLSALSEAAYVFDAALLHAVLTTLGPAPAPALPLAEHAALAT